MIPWWTLIPTFVLGMVAGFVVVANLAMALAAVNGAIEGLWG